jgi:hypothetical protein
MSDLLEATRHLPWGLHDGLLQRLKVDYTTWSAEMHVRFMMNERQTRVRLGRVSISGLLFISIDPPTSRGAGDPTPLDPEDDGGLTIDAGSVAALKSWPTGLPRPPEGHWLNYVYLMEANGFVYVCARDARFEWIDESESDVVGGVFFPGEEIPDPSP